MKSKFLSITITLSVISMASVPAMAIVNPEWERPLLKSEMTVLAGQGEYKKIEKVMLILNKRDGMENPTSLTLEYTTQNGERVSQTIPIPDQPRSLACGSTAYQAALPIVSVADSFAAERLDINLVDNRKQECPERGKKGFWEASVHHGFGFNKVNDDTLKLVGNPRGVITPMLSHGS